MTTPDHTPPSTACKRCGTCCRNGGPALHREDLSLLLNQTIQHQQLITVRQGEPAFSPLANRVIPAEQEFLKLAGKDGSWACLLYDQEKAICSIYDRRPLECRVLECWNPRELAAVIGKETLCRSDVMNPGDPIRGLLETHEEECSFATIMDLLDGLQSDEEEVMRKLSQIVTRDLAIRQRARQEFQMADAYELFLFGRPVFISLKPYGISISEENGAVVLHRG